MKDRANQCARVKGHPAEVQNMKTRQKQAGSLIL